MGLGSYWGEVIDVLREIIPVYDKVNSFISLGKDVEHRNRAIKGRVKKGDKILDIGCGFGTAAAYIAKQTGCEVTGITLSKNQLDYAVQNAKELNLDNQINFELRDYREMKGKFDKIYSIGMFEHTSLKYYNCLLYTSDAADE